MDGLIAESTVSQILNDEIDVVGKTEEKYKQIDESEKFIFMPSGEALSLKETYSIVAKEKTKLIVVVGPSESGKTTLEATIYQMFQKGKFSEYIFAGSKTLQGYEDRVHYTRITSGKSKPDTPRTSTRVNEQFLHLRVYNKKEDEYINFLFADIAGENFEACIADSQEMQRRYSYFKNVDCFVAVIDGKQLRNNAKRRSIPEKTKQIFRTIVDAGLCKKDCALQIVVSKYDEVDDGTDYSEDVMQYLENTRKKLSNYFNQYFSKVVFFNTAALPKLDSNFDYGQGIDNLFADWCKEKEIKHLWNSDIESEKKLVAEFNRLSYKLLET